jgi:endonuclease/exonuclease/phosphatase family metal-dependent hydrolase
MKSGSRVGAYVLALLFAFCLSPFAFADSPDLLETGSGVRVEAPAPFPSEIKVVSYNIRWRSGEDLRAIINLLRNDPEIGRASIIGLQEADRNKKRSGYTNTARLMADELGMHYAWAAPPLAEKSSEREEETGVAILSPYPMKDVVRLVLPHPGPGGRRRAAIGATIRIGQKLIRVYSAHAETRISTEKRGEQLEAMLRDLKNYPQAVSAVVLGDFNTIDGQSVEDTTELFTDAGFETPFPNSLKTWKTFVLELKLDWIWLRDLRPSDYGVDRKVGFSDHFPLWVKINLNGKAPGRADIRGRITKISRAESMTGNGQALGTLLVEGASQEKPRFDKAFVRVNKGTSINVRRGRGQEHRPISFDELRVGDRIEVRFTLDRVLMSFPVQATAADIIVIK